MSSEDESTNERAALRQFQLLVALVCFHVGGPLIYAIAPSLALTVLSPLYVLLLAAATLTMSSYRGRLIMMLLGTPMLFSAGFIFLLDRPEPLALSFSALPFLVYTSCVVFRYVLSTGLIDQARLLGAASVFILMAQAWAGLYSGLELVDTGSFVLPGDAAVGPGDLAYFSLVTQTTLGYGDVTPTSPIVRALATLQATAGLFYMGVVVARFAGRLQLSHTGQRADQANPPGVIEPHTTNTTPSSLEHRHGV